eukprot:TRINITY_DN74561_c0_g1_i1.p1 TRINITY_DN74561_c0_g1~~TRINITY_DN74561_c0_g1_i1.p1  ORF type:complete len:294 (+),score=52.12 TRINITY_DN74561_c0_g1_i1:43-924(+)
MAVLLCLVSALTSGAVADYVSETWSVDVMKDTESKHLTGSFQLIGPMSAYLSEPETILPETPIVVVVHHAVGIYHQAFLRQYCDDLAEQGYLAILPDFFHRVWSDDVPTGLGMPFEKMKIPAMLGSLKDAEIIEDLQQVFSWIEKSSGARQGRVAVLGFCMGGRIAWLAAVEESLKGKIHAAVPYHGGNVFKGLGPGAEAPAQKIQANLGCPVLGHFGKLDQNPSLADATRLQELAGGRLTVKSYEGADHGFSCKDSAKYVEDAAQTAWHETLRFLKENIHPDGVKVKQYREL